MTRIKMEWGWANDYPIFVYMKWLDNNLWEVKIVKGIKGNQNAGNTTPNAPAWFKYTSKQNSRYGVGKEAIRIAKKKLKKED